MNSRLVASFVLVASCLWQGGCSTMQAPAITTDMAALTVIPPANPALDHFIAWIPVEQAQTASVAEAMMHISLGNARARMSQQHCGGTSLRQGHVIEKLGPLPALSPATRGGKPAWYYRISQQPGHFGCQHLNSASLYRAMQQELLDWISIEPAGNGAQQLGMLKAAH
jgi:hypothetical protein